MEELPGTPADSNEVAPSSSSQPKRRHRPGLHRTQIACQRCRLRKNKCDGKLPQCTTCERAGSPCIVVDRLTYREYPRGHVEELEARVQQLEHEVNDLREQLSRAVSSQNFREPGTAQVSGSSQDGAGSPNTTEIAHDIGLLSLEGASERKYVGESSGVHFGKIIQTVLPRTDYNHDQGPPHSRWKLRVTRPIPGNSPSSEAFQIEPLPQPDLATKLVEAYFTHRWPSLPFLHKPTFMEKHYLPVMYLKGNARHASLFLTYMVFSLGTIDLLRQKEDLPASHLDYFRTATFYYLDGLVEQDNLETIQGLLLMSSFAINEPQSLNAWHVSGLAMRMAIDLGLHRHTDDPQVGLLQAEMRKRVFWSAYALDRNISIALGRPFALRDMDINVSLPIMLSDKDLSAGTPRPIVDPQKLSAMDMSTFIHVIKIRRIGSTIQDIFYPTDTSSISEEFVEDQRSDIRQRLEAWMGSAPRYPSPTLATFQSTEWFQIAYYHALLLLYRPSPARPYASQEALQVCSDSAISLISSYSSLYAKNKITYTWVALHSLFMASVTMLYTLWVGEHIRKHTTKGVVISNVETCLSLFRNMGELWPAAAERCYHIVERLGRATTAVFDNPTLRAESSINAFNIPYAANDNQNAGEINMEYMNWFGTRAETQPTPSHVENTQSDGAIHQQYNDNQNEQFDFDSTMPIDSQLDNLADLDNLFQLGFDLSLPLMTNVFDHNPFLQQNEVQDQDQSMSTDGQS